LLFSKHKIKRAKGPLKAGVGVVKFFKKEKINKNI